MSCLAIGLLAVLAPVRARAVFGGKTIRASRYPALIQITAKQIPEGRGTLCGGGLVAPQVVITAAHCLGTNPETERHIEPFTIVSGRQRAYAFTDPAGGVTIAVDKTARAPANPRLHQSFSDDVALLHLVRRAPFAPFGLAAPASARPGFPRTCHGLGAYEQRQSVGPARDPAARPDDAGSLQPVVPASG